MSKNYQKGDFFRMGWEEYGETLETLHRKVEEYVETNNTEFDAVVPVLRAGNFPGTYLAYKLGVLKIIPVQYKYMFDEQAEEARLRRLRGLRIDNLPEDPDILLVEGDHCFGTTAEAAAKGIKEKLPGSTIVYAADHVDYSYQKNEHADAIFYGRLTNETRELAEEECREKGVQTGSSLFPWENLEEEWETVQGKQHQYRDLDSVSTSSETVEKIDLGE